MKYRIFSMNDSREISRDVALALLRSARRAARVATVRRGRRTLWAIFHPMHSRPGLTLEATAESKAIPEYLP